MTGHKDQRRISFTLRVHMNLSTSDIEDIARRRELPGLSIQLPRVIDPQDKQYWR